MGRACIYRNLYLLADPGGFMKFNLYDTVKIKKDCKEGVKNGETGVVIVVFEEPQEAYEVEVLDENGNTKAQCTLCADDLEKVSAFGSGDAV